ncbi:MAG: hypothetical protein NTW52_20160 [Planctomycetota bacterium]|nr:hypothetical protein [Planctomycetota bacterium]
MTKSKKRKPLPPRVKRMKRPARLESAKKWIPTYTGKHLLRGYCNHYAVDWRCAAIELELLGIRIDSAYIAKRERTEAELTKQRQTRKEERKSPQNLHWHPFTDAYSAYMAGDFAAIYDSQMREEYSDEWEQHAINEPPANREHVVQVWVGKEANEAD